MRFAAVKAGHYLFIILWATSLMALVPGPVQAQSYSASYKFLKAVKEKDYAAIKKAVEKGVNINTRDYDDKATALVIAARQKDSQLMKYLLANGAKPNLYGDNGETALMLAVGLRSKEMTAALLHYKADPDVTDKNGETALIRAVIAKARNSVELLLEAGADYTLEDYSGRTALQHAREGRNRRAIKLLEEAGAKF